VVLPGGADGRFAEPQNQNRPVEPARQNRPAEPLGSTTVAAPPSTRSLPVIELSFTGLPPPFADIA
jgi:hypothetical protein